MPQILIVEDEAAIADTLIFALQSEGFATHWLTLASAALAYQQNGQAAQAEKAIERGLELAPENPQVLSTAAAWYRSRGKLAKAQELGVPVLDEAGMLALLAAPSPTGLQA